MSNPKWLMGLTPDHDRIWIKLPYYDPSLNKELKARLPAPVRWNRDAKRWEFPLKWDTCLGARRVATDEGHDIVLSGELQAWATEEKARQGDIPDVNAMELVDLAAVRQGYPRIWEAISSRPFQTVGAAFAARNRSCLIADQPGLGKTVQSLAAIIEAGINGPILVVAPKQAAQITWPQEIRKWIGPSEEVLVLEASIPRPHRGEVVAMFIEKAKANPDKRFWVITSPNYVRIKAELDDYGKYKKVNGRKVIHPVQEGIMELIDATWSSIIVDESHQTLAGASGDKKKQSAQRMGLGAIDTKDDGLRIALSGTPFRGREEYLWGQLNFLKPELFRSRWRWINDHFDVGSNGFGTVIGQMIDREGMYKEAATVMIRRTKEEVAKDLPPKQYAGWPLYPAEYEQCSDPDCYEIGQANSEGHEHQTKPPGEIAIWLDMDPKQAKAYEQIQRLAKAELEGGDLLIIGMLSQLTRLKQVAGSSGKMVQGSDGDMHFKPTLPSNKFDWLVEFLDERGIDKKMLTLDRTSQDPRHARKDVPKIVVASQFSQLIDVIEQGLLELGIPCHKITGSVNKPGQREAIVDDWQNNPTSSRRVLLLTTTAGGTSLTLDAASDLVVLDETWSVSDQEQLEDRIHRLSRMHQVTIWKVFSRGTIEEKISRDNLHREASIKAIIDGERGVNFAKTFLF